MSLADSLERAATDLQGLADRIRPANGDPHRLLEELDGEQARQVLAWMLAEAPADAEELVEAWSEVDAGARVLLSTPESGLAKPGRKLLRRAHHRLRSRGLAVPEAPAPARVASPRAFVVQDDLQQAHVSVPDPRGARMAYLVESHPAGGARLFECRFDLERGILDFKVYNAGRSRVRGFLRSLTAGVAQRLFPVDRDALRALLRRASLAQASDRPLPTAFVEWRGRLFDESVASHPVPGALARESLGPAGDRAAALEEVGKSVRDGRIGPWPPASSWLVETEQRAREAVAGLEGAARGEAIDRWLEEASRDLAARSEADLLARHLEELAWVRWQSDAEEAARALLAAADGLREDVDAVGAIARARVEELFSPLLAELRVVEVSASGADAPDDGR